MKKAYTAPRIICVGMEMDRMIAASTSPDPNVVVDSGNGVNSGGYAHESGKEEGDGGTVDDMSKDHGWNLWEE